MEALDYTHQPDGGLKLSDQPYLQVSTCHSLHQPLIPAMGQALIFAVGQTPLPALSQAAPLPPTQKGLSCGSNAMQHLAHPIHVTCMRCCEAFDTIKPLARKRLHGTTWLCCARAFHQSGLTPLPCAHLPAQDGSWSCVVLKSLKASHSFSLHSTLHHAHELDIYQFVHSTDCDM